MSGKQIGGADAGEPYSWAILVLRTVRTAQVRCSCLDARTITIVGLFVWLTCGCHKWHSNDQPPDRRVASPSQYPVTVDPSRVGSYSALTKSGGGFFYDDVLEYRVWTYPKRGGDDYYRAFASYEPALEYSKSTPAAEKPLVLVRQLKWINEPNPGQFEECSGERIAEWQVEWLSGNKRLEDSITKFLAEKGAQK